MKYNTSVEQIVLTNTDKNVLQGEWKFMMLLGINVSKSTLVFGMGWNAATFRAWHEVYQ